MHPCSIHSIRKTSVLALNLGDSRDSAEILRASVVCRGLENPSATLTATFRYTEGERSVVQTGRPAELSLSLRLASRRLPPIGTRAIRLLLLSNKLIRPPLPENTESAHHDLQGKHLKDVSSQTQQDPATTTARWVHTAQKTSYKAGELPASWPSAHENKAKRAAFPSDTSTTGL
ncbi:hypothetical protein AOLI_G00080590 [Acnodon oligacanthus]